MIKENQKIFNFLFAVFNALLCVLAMVCAFGVRFYVLSGERGVHFTYYMQLTAMTVPVHFLLSHSFGLNDSFRRKNLITEIGKVIEVSCLDVLFVFLLSFMLKEVNVSRGVVLLFGAFNGTLVAVFKIQPMVATLILYTAGRSIAAWINNNELPMISDPSFAYYGNFLPGVAVPTPIFIAVICMILAWALLRFTNIGLYSQAVGINASAARLNGIHPQFVKFLTYVILGLCVAVAGFIKVSRFSTINYSVVAKDIEMDAILAVALGGNALSGGKFNIWASVLGAYVIQFLTTTLFKFNVVSSALPAYKAVVVIILVVLSAPTVREKLEALKKRHRTEEKKEAGTHAE